MFTRRDALLTSALTLGGCAVGGIGRAPRRDFVSVDGTRLMLGARPYRFTGANMWYAAYLGAKSTFGDRGRLVRELDRLVALGVDNVRILASSEQSPLRNSITPAFRDASANYSPTLLEGLDFALAEMGRRNMRAVLYLANFWEWSGGMMTHLYWTNGGRFINMNDPAHPWPEFPDFVANFYSSPAAVALYHHYVRAMVGRRNSITGVPYADDPTIMAWQLANEPRPGGSDAVAQRQLPAYLAWIASSARLIKSIDPNHLVSTGSEGSQGCMGKDECVVAAHSSPDIDYVTAHVWPQNWGWADPADLAGTWAEVEARTRAYVAAQAATATRLSKPLVIEEFGFPRDEGSLDPASTTFHKDRFYDLVYGIVADSARARGPIAGSNFWAWGGEGRAAHADHRFHPGDTSYAGDPPHEPQGWYSVFDGDSSTKALIARRAVEVRSAS